MKPHCNLIDIVIGNIDVNFILFKVLVIALLKWMKVLMDTMETGSTTEDKEAAALAIGGVAGDSTAEVEVVEAATPT